MPLSGLCKHVSCMREVVRMNWLKPSSALKHVQRLKPTKGVAKITNCQHTFFSTSARVPPSMYSSTTAICRHQHHAGMASRAVQHSSAGTPTPMSVLVTQINNATAAASSVSTTGKHQRMAQKVRAGAVNCRPCHTGRGMYTYAGCCQPGSR